MAMLFGLVLFLMLLLILFLILLACKPWRFFSSSRHRTIKVGDLERPLVTEDVQTLNQRNDSSRNFFIDEGHFSSPQTRGPIHKQKTPAPNLTQSDSFVLDVIPDPTEEISVSYTLKNTLLPNRLVEEQRHASDNYTGSEKKVELYNDSLQERAPNIIADQRSSLTLEVISGPSRGLSCSVQSTSTSRLPLTLGRVSPSDLLLKDSEVSGKHAMINWNLNKLKWELVDMGSLNGTLLNSRAVNHHNSGSRHWGVPMELANGDVITLGTTSKIYVRRCTSAWFGLGERKDKFACSNLMNILY